MTPTWFDRVILDLGRQMRWSFLPPLMIYFSYGVSGLTAIVGTFFVKDYLGLSASFLAGLAFWVGLPWALKMPLGHLVDLIWRYKSILIYLGAGLIAVQVVVDLVGVGLDVEGVDVAVSGEGGTVFVVQGDGGGRRGAQQCEGDGGQQGAGNLVLVHGALRCNQ